MLELSETARDELKAYFEGKEKSDIRIFLASSCSGVHLSMALDTPTEEDEIFEKDGFVFIVNKDLLSLTGNINIDMGPLGFSIDSEKNISNGEGGCRGCPAAGSCGG